MIFVNYDLLLFHLEVYMSVVSELTALWVMEIFSHMGLIISVFVC